MRIDHVAIRFDENHELDKQYDGSGLLGIGLPELLVGFFESHAVS